VSKKPRGRGRPPFDPSRVKGDEDQPGLFDAHKQVGGAGVITVQELTRLVKGAIDKHLPQTLHVAGELSNLSQPSGGHLYFTLKDEFSEVRCVMWRSAASSLKFSPLDGMSVLATGGIEVYEPRGQYQLYVRKLEPRGVGALELAFRQLKEKLEKEGLFDPARKHPLPRLPRRIAVVTSPTGAAIQDILQTISRRFPCLRVMVFPVRVQGEGAAAEIADAITRLNHNAAELGGIDVMIVGRGGGSLEDLWAFNEEIVARAIHASAIPVVSAVGHEVDFTIADFVADIRAATPTAAAELVVPVLADVLDSLTAINQSLVRGMRRMLDAAASRVALTERSEWFRDPMGRIRQLHQRTDEVQSRLQLASSRWLGIARERLHDHEMRLNRVRPAAVLAQRRELLGEMEHRLRWSQGHLNLVAERRLREALAALLSASPMSVIQRGRVLLDQLGRRLHHGSASNVTKGTTTIDSLEARIRASGHEQILKRGFSMTKLRKTNKLVHSATDVRAGDEIETRTADGSFTSQVIDESGSRVSG
jgi:exodeoxyribonuclease VII large subunit